MVKNRQKIMGLEEQINNDIKTAMLAKEASKLEALRAIKAAVLLLKTSPEGLTEESGVKAMQKMVKMLVAYMPYKYSTHRIITDMTHPWLIGYRRHPISRGFWKYVDIDTSKLPQ